MNVYKTKCPTNRACVYVALMDIMSYKSNYPAFKYNPNAIADFRDKLQLSIPDEKLPELIRDLIKKYVLRVLSHAAY